MCVLTESVLRDKPSVEDIIIMGDDDANEQNAPESTATNGNQEQENEGENLICAPIQVIIPNLSDEDDEEEEDEEEEEEEEKKKKKKKKGKPRKEKIQALTFSFITALRLVNEQRVITNQNEY